MTFENPSSRCLKICSEKSFSSRTRAIAWLLKYKYKDGTLLSYASSGTRTNKEFALHLTRFDSTQTNTGLCLFSSTNHWKQRGRQCQNRISFEPKAMQVVRAIALSRTQPMKTNNLIFHHWCELPFPSNQQRTRCGQRVEIFHLPVHHQKKNPL